MVSNLTLGGTGKRERSYRWALSTLSFFGGEGDGDAHRFERNQCLKKTLSGHDHRPLMRGDLCYWIGATLSSYAFEFGLLNKLDENFPSFLGNLSQSVKLGPGRKISSNLAGNSKILGCFFDTPNSNAESNMFERLINKKPKVIFTISQDEYF